MTQRRVVITGLGPVTPIATGAAAFWNALLEKRNSVRRGSVFDPSRFESGGDGRRSGLQVDHPDPLAFGNGVGGGDDHLPDVIMLERLTLKRP